MYIFLSEVRLEEEEEEEEEEEYKNYLRMTPECFEELFALLNDDVTN